MNTTAPRPPKPRNPQPRLPEAARTLDRGAFIDVADTVTAICVRSHGRGRGWKMVQQIQKDGKIRVWRTK